MTAEAKSEAMPKAPEARSADGKVNQLALPIAGLRVQKDSEKPPFPHQQKRHKNAHMLDMGKAGFGPVKDYGLLSVWFTELSLSVPEILRDLDGI